MSFAEIILRIGASIGGWLIFIGYALTLAVIRQADCDPTSDELWRGTLFFGLLSGLSLLFVGRGLPWRNTIRWFSIPAIGLAVYAGLGIFPALGATSIDGASLCGLTNTSMSSDELSGFRASNLERIWPVVQLVVLCGGILQSVRYWTSGVAPVEER